MHIVFPSNHTPMYIYYKFKRKNPPYILNLSHNSTYILTKAKLKQKKMYIRHDKTDCSKAKNNQDSIITEQKYCCNIL